MCPRFSDQITDYDFPKQFSWILLGSVFVRLKSEKIVAQTWNSPNYRGN